MSAHSYRARLRETRFCWRGGPLFFFSPRLRPLPRSASPTPIVVILGGRVASLEVARGRRLPSLTRSVRRLSPLSAKREGRWLEVSQKDRKGITMKDGQLTKGGISVQPEL